MNKHVIQKEELISLFPVYRTAPHGHIVTTCPFCNKENHFYINLNTQLWDCKKCGEDGNIFKLLNFLGKLYLVGDFKSIDRSYIKNLGELEEEKNKKIDLTTPERRLPYGFKRLYFNDYLKRRGFIKRNYEDHVIGFTNVKIKLKDYIIFSVMEDNICKGYVSRYIKDTKDKRIPRYKNDKGANFSKLFFGFNELNNLTNTVLLVEGLMDKITLDNYFKLYNQSDIKCLCTFGKKISSFQTIKLLEKGIKNIVLLYDEDAIKEMKKISLTLENFFNVAVGFTKNNDINDSSEKEIEYMFENLKSPLEFNRSTVSKLKL